MANLLYGDKVGESIKIKIKKDISILSKMGITPTIAIIRFENNNDDILYEKSIIKVFSGLNIDTVKYEFVLDLCIDKEKYLKINMDKDIHSIIVLGAIPKTYDFIYDSIKPAKDVDCIGKINLFKIYSNDNPVFYPCTPLAVIFFLKHYNINIKHQNIIVIGRSQIVGKPLSFMLLNEDATVTIAHSKTKNIDNLVKNFDIVVSCCGVPKMIKAQWLVSNQVVIDVGINYIENELCGDVDYKSIFDDTIKVTPVPKGIGSVTTLLLAFQTTKAALLQNELL